MSAQDLEQRARELLAAEYERDDRPSDADFVNLGLPLCDADIRALRAIVAALRQQPAPVDLEQFREAVECWRDAALPANSVDAERVAEADRLLSIIDNAGKLAHQPAPVVPTLPGNWPEDAGHENGGYECLCSQCGATFYGHKRRVVCRVCAKPAPVVDEVVSEVVASLRNVALLYEDKTCARSNLITAALLVEHVAARAQEVQPIIDNAGKVESAEPEQAGVVYQLQDDFLVWSDTDEATFNWWRNSGRRNTRKLYTAPHQPAPVVDAGNWIAADDVRRLTREIDVALNGEAGAAPQASLCDIAAQVKSEVRKRGAPLLAAPVVPAYEVFRIAGGDTECEPNPTPERALEVLRDLRACYDEALRLQPAPVVDDAMVERACRNRYPGWDMYGDGGRKVRADDMRADLTAALARAQGVQS